MFGSNPPTGGTGSASTSGTATPITIGDNTTSSITRVMHSSTESNLDPNILKLRNIYSKILINNEFPEVDSYIKYIPDP